MPQTRASVSSLIRDHLIQLRICNAAAVGVRIVRNNVPSRDVVMEGPTQSWSVIIFCYNEESTLRSVIETVQDFFETIHCTQSEIIIVDDGSTDNCPEIARKAEERYSNVKAIYHSRNFGIGCALRSGYSAVQNENVCAVPADGQFNVAELIPHADVPQKTLVSFYRRENTVYSLKRNLLSLVNRKVNANCLGLKLRDVNWVKVYKRAELEKLDLKMTSSLVESEICAKLILQENNLIECGSVYHPRKAGKSKGASVPVVLRAARETLKLLCVVNFYRLKRNRRYAETAKPTDKYCRVTTLNGARTTSSAGGPVLGSPDTVARPSRAPLRRQ